MKAAWIAALLSLAGCDLAFDGLAPSEGPRFAMQLRVYRAESTYFAGVAVLKRGTDARGRLHDVNHPLLYVDGESAHPHAVRDQTTWGYEFGGAHGTMATMGDSLVVRVPSVATAGASPPATLTVTLPRATAWERIDVAPEADLVITVEQIGAQVAGVERRYVSWILVVGGNVAPGAPRQFITRDGQGSYPAELRVSRLALDSLGTTDLRAVLRTASIFVLSALPYDASLDVQTDIEWTVRLSGAAEPARTR